MGVDCRDCRGRALSIYALYWTQAIITTQVYRATFLMLVLALTFFYFPFAQSGRARRFPGMMSCWQRWALPV
jgi:hypothetical protein